MAAVSVISSCAMRQNPNMEASPQAKQTAAVRCLTGSSRLLVTQKLFNLSNL